MKIDLRKPAGFTVYADFGEYVRFDYMMKISNKLRFITSNLISMGECCETTVYVLFVCKTNDHIL